MLSLTLMVTAMLASAQTSIDSLLGEFPAKDQVTLNRLIEELAGMGPTAIVDISKKLSVPGNADDLQARFALSALAKGKSAHTPKIESGFIEALQGDLDLEAQVFLIQELQFMASDASVDVLLKKINVLCEPVVHALGSIHTKKSLNALLQSVDQINGYCKQVLAKTLASYDDGRVVDQLTRFSSARDELFRKEALHGLAKSGSYKALPTLEQYATEKPESGTELLLLLAENLAGNGQGKQAAQIAEKVLNSNPGASNQYAAYQLFIQHAPRNEVDQLVKVFRKAEPQSKQVISQMLVQNPGLPLEGFIKQIDKLEPATQINLLHAARIRHQQAALSHAHQLIHSPNLDVATVAIQTYAALSGKKGLPSLQKALLNAKDPQLLTVAGQAISGLVDSSNLDFLSNAFAMSSGIAKSRLLMLFGERGLSRFWDQVRASLSDDDPEVRATAFEVLPDIVRDVPVRQLTTIAPIINSEAEMAQLRSALHRKATLVDDPNEIAAPLIQTFGTSSRKLLENVLPAIGGSRALEYIHAGNSKEPLLAWQHHEAIHSLFPLLEEAAFRDKAYAAILRLVNDEAITGAQQVLHLRRLMEYALKPEQKKEILSRIGRTKKHTAFTYVSRFLNDSILQMDAAKALVNIALPASGEKHGLWGSEVKRTLMRVDTIFSRSDDEYTRAFLHRYLVDMPQKEGFVSMFNGKDLAGWKALVANPLVRDSLFGIELQKLQREADAKIGESWKVEDGKIIFFGEGYDNLCTDKDYRDFEMYVDWKIKKDGDSGLYLRGSPQVQIWDPAKDSTGVGSGGLFNNKVHLDKPLLTADNPVGTWNTFRVLMIDDKVTVYLNGKLVTDHVVLENYWDRAMPIFRKGQIELQAHTTPLEFRDLYIRTLDEVPVLNERETMAGYKSLFNGINLDGWVGNKVDYVVEDGSIVIYPGPSGGSGNLFTEQEYSDFILKFDFKLTPGANNGLGIHAPLEGDAAYLGKEIQILDNTAEKYAHLKPYQFHGSVYGLIPARRGLLKPVGQWNQQEVSVKGNRIGVVLNGERILFDDLANATRNGTLDGKDHPGIEKLKGHIGFLGHGSEVHFRNIRILDLSEEE